VESRGVELSRLRRHAKRRHGKPLEGNVRMPEIVIYDHIGFKGAYARTNLSFHYLGDFWNDRISCVIVVSGVWRFYRDEYYKGDYWDLGPVFTNASSPKPARRRRQLLPGHCGDVAAIAAAVAEMLG
jgi:hypothetical protein